MSKNQNSNAQTMEKNNEKTEALASIAQKSKQVAIKAGNKALKAGKSTIGSKPSEKLGSGTVAGSALYGLLTGDVIGSGAGILGGLALRFRDKIEAALDAMDKVLTPSEEGDAQ